jgi:hypothetical protein
MKQVKVILFRIMFVACVLSLVASCKKTEMESIIENVEETLNDVNTRWGASTDEIKRHMNGYVLVGNDNSDILEYKTKNGLVVVAYQFHLDKLCAAVVKSLKDTESTSDSNDILSNFNYVGETGGKNIYTNETDNVFAVKYEITEEEKIYLTIGFTPLEPMVEQVSGKDCVDLGINRKWATCNIGASSPDASGGYFAWGEVAEKDSYSWDTYELTTGSLSGCLDLGESISGTQYDAATKLWGNMWVTPTESDVNELIKNCSWVWSSENGVKGYKVFGKNGNYMFVPASGFKRPALQSSGSYGYYMTAMPDKTTGNCKVLIFNSTEKEIGKNYRCRGFVVRAVVK